MAIGVENMSEISKHSDVNETEVEQTGENTEASEVDQAFSKKMESSSEQTDNTEQKKLPRCPDSTGGHWEDPEKRGNCKWIPDDDYVPGDRNGTNPEHKTWGEIKKEYDFESIPFKDGYPDFSEVSEAEVEIDDFTDDRAANFDSADEKLAEERGCEPEDIEKWRKENKYTWHEKEDCKTMELVPSEVHGNIPHEGGYSKAKNGA